MNKQKIFYVVSLLVLPSATSAFSLSQSNFKGVVDEVRSVLDLLIPVLVVLAFVYFFWGLSKFILHSDNEKDIEKGKNYMIWGIIALFILISFRTIIGLISSELELGDSSVVPLLKTDAQTYQTSGRFIIP